MSLYFTHHYRYQDVKMSRCQDVKSLHTTSLRKYTAFYALSTRWLDNYYEAAERNLILPSYMHFTISKCM